MLQSRFCASWLYTILADESRRRAFSKHKLVRHPERFEGRARARSVLATRDGFSMRRVQLNLIQSKSQGCLACALALSLFAIPGCRSSPGSPAAHEQRSGAPLASLVYTSDPSQASQLLSGFYAIEEYSWRWTDQRFSVVLRPPDGVTSEDTNLVMHLTIPDIVIEKLHSVSLSAVIGNVRLGSETYAKPGPYVFTRRVAARLLNAEQTRVDFCLNKVMAPVGRDVRQLGIAVNSIALEPR